MKSVILSVDFLWIEEFYSVLKRPDISLFDISKRIMLEKRFLFVLKATKPYSKKTETRKKCNFHSN